MSIELRHAAACYQSADGEVEAVRDVSFAVTEGAFVSLVGPSGCGKSTLLSAIAGLEPLSGGSIRIDGQPVEGTSPKVGFMPQRDQLFEWRNIWDNVTLGLTVRGEKDAAAYAHVSELLERCGCAGAVIAENVSCCAQNCCCKQNCCCERNRCCREQERCCERNDSCCD